MIDTLIYGETKTAMARSPPPPTKPTLVGLRRRCRVQYLQHGRHGQLSALQTAVTMLRPFPEQKSLVYFGGAGGGLNGTTTRTTAARRRTPPYGPNVSIHAVDARGSLHRLLLATRPNDPPGGFGMFTGQLAMTAASNFQRSQDTLYSRRRTTGGTAMVDYNDLSRGIEQAANTMTTTTSSGSTAANGGRRALQAGPVTLGTDAKVSCRTGRGTTPTRICQIPGAERERQLEEALMLENPITDITMQWR